MESINNPAYDGSRVRFSAITNGCTTSSDFVIEHVINNDKCELTVVRTKPDFCRKASTLTSIELEWSMPPASTGLGVVFLNPRIGKLEAGHHARPLQQKKITTEPPE